MTVIMINTAVHTLQSHKPAKIGIKEGINYQQNRSLYSCTCALIIKELDSANIKSLKPSAF